MNLWLEVVEKDETEGCIYSESGPYETRYDNVGDLYRDLRKTYSGKVNKMYIEDTDKGTVQIGWVFEGKHLDYERYTFIRSVWCVVMQDQPIIRKIYKYAKFRKVS